MICCSFVFEQINYDDEFNILNKSIEDYARSLQGFIKVENWKSLNNEIINAMYFFSNMESVNKLANFSNHIEAKKNVKKWYKNYRVEIMSVVSTYGDKNLKVEDTQF